MKAPSDISETEVLCGVPVRRLNPSNAESRFTCHAFSTDGSRMVTGETDGTVRLWDTVDYEELCRESKAFERNVVCLSFVDFENDEVVGMDASGAVIQFSFERIQDSERPAACKKHQVMARTREPVGALKEGTCLKDVSGQFSQDGRILVGSRREKPNQVYEFRLEDSVEHKNLKLKFSSDNRIHDLPVADCHHSYSLLSGDGGHILFNLVRSRPMVPVTAVVRIDGSFKGVSKTNFDDTCGLWAKRGKYLMLWRERSSQNPMLEVFVTERLTRYGSKGVQYRLERGNLKWSAQMLEKEEPWVAIHTVAQSGKHRIRLWDVNANVVRREVVFDTMPERDVSGWIYADDETSRQNSQRVTSLEAMEDMIEMTDKHRHKDFCISEDNEWAIVFCQTSHRFVICSLSTSIAVWDMHVPENVAFDPFRLHNQVLFDRHGCPILLGDAAILVTSPAFFARLIKKNKQLEYFARSEIQIESYLSSTLAHLPTKALARIVATDGSGRDWLEYAGQCMKVQSVIDVAVSENGDLVAMIATVNKELVVAVGQAVDLVRAHDRGHWTVFWMQNTESEQLFLFKNNQGVDTVVLLNAKKREAIFCNLKAKDCEMHELAIDWIIHSVTQTKDRQRLTFLSAFEAKIYNLAQQDFEHRVNYKAFDNSLSFNRHPRERNWYLCSDMAKYCSRQVSEDGRTVLVGWDGENKRSITVKEDTTDEEIHSKILTAGESFSVFCSLSRDGLTTLFVDIDALSTGLLAIGLFNEPKKIIVQSVVLQLLPVSMSKSEKNAVLKNVFYDLIDEDAILITVRTPCNGLASASLDECITKFDVRQSSAAFNYYQLTSHPSFNVDTSPKKYPCHSGSLNSVGFVRWLKRFGISVFNVPQYGWMSIFQEAILRRNWDLVESIKRLALENKFQLSIQLHGQSMKNKPNFVLETLLASESTNDSLKAMELICSETTPIVMAAEGMQLAVSMLSSKYPYIVQQTLFDKALKLRICEIDVHADFMNADRRRDDAVHINTVDNLAEWTAEDPDFLGHKWRQKNKNDVGRMEKSGNTSMTRMALIIVGIADAARVGMQGIVRLLLMQKAPAEVFKSDIVKWVVMYKWKIWRQRSIWMVAIYFCFLAVYMTYALLLGSSADLVSDPAWKKRWMTAFLVFVVGFGCRMLIEEVAQMKTFVQEGLRQEKGWMWGLHYHLLSRWNWIDLFSCLMLVIVLPLFHTLAVFGIAVDEALSAFVAIEAIVAAFKMWYFAQPFRKTGSMVLMVNNVIKDCFYFLALTVFILIGFTVALYVLYRHAVKGVPSVDDCGDELISFSTFPRSLVTMFFALLANFEAEVVWSAGNLTVLVIVIFTLFLLVQLIVLLNLLIAIMGDTFDRVKSTEEDQLQLGRAIFIDACEAAMSESEKKKMNKEIGKYVCALMPLDDENRQDSQYQWMGKMNVLKEHFNESLKKSEDILLNTLQQSSTDSMGSVKEMEKEITGLRREMEREINGLRKEMEEMKDDIKKEMEGMKDDVNAKFEAIKTLLQRL